MSKKPQARVILVVLAASVVICVAIGIAFYAYMSVWTFNRLPKVSTQGTFVNSLYTAPNKNFACKFPWQNMEGETLTDGLDQETAWVKYRNDFGVNIAVQDMPEQDDFTWPEDRHEQEELLDSLFDNTVSNSRSQARNLAVIYSEHRDTPRLELFAITEYNMDQNDSSLVKRGDLFFFEGAHYYIITFAVYEWDPMYNNIKGEEWVAVLDKEVHGFYSGCEFK